MCGLTKKNWSLLVFLCLAGLPAAGAVEITADPTVQYQTIDGFGAHGAMNVWWSSGPFYNDNFLDLIVDDLGLTIIRNEYYPKSDDPGQWTKQIPYLQALKAKADASGEPLKFIASYWSPPSWMKINGSTVGNPTDPNDKYINRLKPENYDDLGDYSVQAIQDYKDIGIDLYALSLQNEPNFDEPYNSCVYNHQQYVDLLKTAGPIIHTAFPNVLLFGAEHMLWAQQYDVSSYEYDIINDTAAAQQMGIWAVHGYGNDGQTPTPGSQEAAEWTAAKNRFHNTIKPLWMTETSGYTDSWADSRQLAQSIYAALKFGSASAWVWWQLSENGVSAFALLNLGTPTKRYYVSKNFYRYIRPGAVRINCSSNDTNVLAVAFKHPTNGTITIVLINTTGSTKNVTLTLDNVIQMPQFDLYRTSATENCLYVGTIDPNVPFALDPNSVTTLFGTGAPPDQAANPWPEDRCLNVSRNTNLHWTAGAHTLSHDVYIGSSAPPAFITNTTETTFDPGTLKSNCSYYWRIDERNEYGVTQGFQWRFATGTDTGDGLVGRYCDGNDLTGVKLRRIDPVVDFNWPANPVPDSIDPNLFSVRWTALVQPRYSQTYTFYTFADDGVRLWVDNILLIDKWFDQPVTEYSNTIALTANEKYDVTMQYYHKGQDPAGARLSWSSSSQPKEIVPQGRLFTVHPPGDLNLDYAVDSLDAAIFTGQWLDSNNCSAEPNCADLDDTNNVDFKDFAVLGENFGL